jgi:hypothetical protein
MAWLTRKNETLRRLLEEAREEKNIAEMKLEYNLKQLGESREVNEKLVKENLQYRSENIELRKANDEKAAKIDDLKKCLSIYQSTKKTSFQEDLEFFVNDCTEAQARELYERLRQRFDSDKGAYIRCQYNFKARVGDTVWVRFNNGSSCIGEVNSIMMFDDGHLDWFRLKSECPHLIHVTSKMVDEVQLVKEREKKGHA